MAETSAAAASEAAIRFDGQLRTIGPWTIVQLPDDASAGLPSRGQVAVTGAMNGHAFQAVLEPDGRRGHWLKVDDGLRHAVGVSDGESVAVAVAPAPEWPEPEVPGDLQRALGAAPDISELWTQITPMARWEWVRWIGATRNPETRARRVEVGISKLRSGKRRPCCFDLAACTDPDLARNGKLIQSA